MKITRLLRGSKSERRTLSFPAGVADFFEAYGLVELATGNGTISRRSMLFGFETINPNAASVVDLMESAIAHNKVVIVGTSQINPPSTVFLAADHFQRRNVFRSVGSACQRNVADSLVCPFVVIMVDIFGDEQI
jgi:hypothetical protein